MRRRVRQGSRGEDRRGADRGAFSRAELEETGAYAVYENCAEPLEAGFPEELKPSA